MKYLTFKDMKELLGLKIYDLVEKEILLITYVDNDIIKFHDDTFVGNDQSCQNYRYILLSDYICGSTATN